MNVVRTNIHVDTALLWEEYQKVMLDHEERIVGIDIGDKESTEKYYKYCFPGSYSHGMRFQGTKTLTLEEERELSNTERATKYDHLFTERNERCVGYINKVLDFLTDAWRGCWWTMEPGFSYKPHRDRPHTAFRAHIALMTNPYCQMAYDDGECHHIPADGRLYLARTDIRHTAWNMGDTPRTHVMLKLPITAWDRYEAYTEYRI